MANIIRRQLERNWTFLVAVMLVLGAFEFLLCAVVASVDVKGAFGEITRFAPPVFRAMIEQNMPEGSAAGLLAFGWNHPVAHALLTAVAITLGARAIAGEVENGAIELVLAQPVSRGEYFAAHALFGAGALMAVLVVGLLGTAIGQAVYSLDAFGLPRLAALFLNAFLLQLALFAVTLLASAFGRETGRVAIVGVLVAVISYLLNALAILWDKAAFLKPLSLHGYYDPRAVLIEGGLSAPSTVILGACAAIGIAAALIRFDRRDLP